MAVVACAYPIALMPAGYPPHAMIQEPAPVAQVAQAPVVAAAPATPAVSAIAGAITQGTASLAQAAATQQQAPDPTEAATEAPVTEAPATEAPATEAAAATEAPAPVTGAQALPTDGSNPWDQPELQSPKIEPAGDAPIMHTGDWIHAIVLGPDEVPPKLPGDEAEGEEDDIYGSGSYGSGSGSDYGSGSDDGSDDEDDDSASAALLDQSNADALAVLQATLADVAAKVEALSTKVR